MMGVLYCRICRQTQSTCSARQFISLFLFSLIIAILRRKNIGVFSNCLSQNHCRRTPRQCHQAPSCRSPILLCRSVPRQARPAHLNLELLVTLDECGGIDTQIVLVSLDHLVKSCRPVKLQCLVCLELVRLWLVKLRLARLHFLHQMIGLIQLPRMPECLKSYE